MGIADDQGKILNTVASIQQESKHTHTLVEQMETSHSNNQVVPNQAVPKNNQAVPNGNQVVPTKMRVKPLKGKKLVLFDLEHSFRSHIILVPRVYPDGVLSIHPCPSVISWSVVSLNSKTLCKKHISRSKLVPAFY